MPEPSLGSHCPAPTVIKEMFTLDPPGSSRPLTNLGQEDLQPGDLA